MPERTPVYGIDYATGDEDPEKVMGYCYVASPDDVAKVLAAHEGGWHFVRFENGDLILACYPKGDTYMDIADAYP